MEYFRPLMLQVPKLRFFEHLYASPHHFPRFDLGQVGSTVLTVIRSKGWNEQKWRCISVTSYIRRWIRTDVMLLDADESFPIQLGSFKIFWTKIMYCLLFHIYKSVVSKTSNCWPTRLFLMYIHKYVTASSYIMFEL